MPNRETRFTTAAEAFDGLGTVHVRVAGYDGPRPVREVSIPVEDLPSQCRRYRAARQACLSAAEFAELMRTGVYTPAPPARVRLASESGQDRA